MDGCVGWLVSSQWRSGGINIPKAITYGMPRTHGKKEIKHPGKIVGELEKQLQRN